MSSGILLTAISGILYGSIGYFGSTLMSNGLSLYDMLLWRFLFSAVCMLPFLPLVCTPTQIWQQRRNLFKLMMLGIFFYGGGTGFYFAAGNLIGTGLAMVLFFTYPLFVVALSCIIDGNKPNLKVMIALLMIVIGCSFIAFGHQTELKLDTMGIILALISGAAYGCYVFSSKNASVSVPPILSTFVVCIGSALAFLPNAIMTGCFYWPTNNSIWMLIALFAIFGTAMPVLLLLAGMKRISSTQASIISVLEPVTVLIVGALVLSEPVSLLQLTGAVTILGSALVIQLK